MMHERPLNRGIADEHAEQCCRAIENTATVMQQSRQYSVFPNSVQYSPNSACTWGFLLLFLGNWVWFLGSLGVGQ